MKQNVLETLTGAVVLLAAVYFLVFAADRTQAVSSSDTYTLMAEFDKVGELSIGSDVRVSGIKVGSVSDLQLDPDTYNAVATIEIESSVLLPFDSTARIESASLLGGNFLSVVPGAEFDMMVDGDRFEFTQGAVGLMDLISRALFSAPGGGTNN